MEIRPLMIPQRVPMDSAVWRPGVASPVAHTMKIAYGTSSATGSRTNRGPPDCWTRAGYVITRHRHISHDEHQESGADRPRLPASSERAHRDSRASGGRFASLAGQPPLIDSHTEPSSHTRRSASRGPAGRSMGGVGRFIPLIDRPATPLSGSLRLSGIDLPCSGTMTSVAGERARINRTATRPRPSAL